VRELDDGLPVRRDAEIGEVDPLEPVRAHSPQAGADPVELAAGAEAGGRGEERERRDEQAERPPQTVEASPVGRGRGAQNDGTDRVGEARRAGVLDGPLPEEGLHEFEVGKAGEAPAPAQREPDEKLRREQGQERPPAGAEGDEREQADRRLVEPGRASIDHVEVAIGLSCSLLHFVKRIGAALVWASRRTAMITGLPGRAASGEGTGAGPRVFVTRRLPKRVREELERHFDVQAHDSELPIPRAELLAGCSACDGLVSTPSDRIDDDLFDAAGSRLRVVANYAVGYDNVDVDAATRRGVVVANTPGVLSEATAEVTMSLLLALTRRVVEGDRLLRRRGRWVLAPTFMLGRGLQGRILGVVGLGRIGREVARLAEAFGMHVVYTNRSGPRADAPYEWLPLDALLARAHVISLHVPLSPETHHLLGAREFRLMRPDALLLNTTRGPVIDEAALIVSLRGGEIGGAALDVFEREPEVPEGLLDLENVVLTPHIGSATLETREAMGMLCVDALKAVLLEGRMPENSVAGSLS
jgi:glyoxylate reductase